MGDDFPDYFARSIRTVEIQLMAGKALENMGHSS